MEGNRAALARLLRVTTQALDVPAAWITVGQETSETVILSWYAGDREAPQAPVSFEASVPILRRWCGRPATLYVASRENRSQDKAFQQMLVDYAALAGEFLAVAPVESAPAVDERGSSAHLRQLHRLTTTEYSRLEDLFEDFLRTGQDIFGLPSAAVVEVHEDGNFARAVVGQSSEVPSIPSDMLAPREDLRTRRTSLHRLSRGVCISARIEIEGELYGILTFWSAEPNPACLFRSQERDVLELMANNIGQFIREQRLTARLLHQANHDPLTGLPNRHDLEQKLHSAVENQADRSPALLYLDLDRFKQVNDSLGHSAGDEVLRRIALRLARTCPGDDVSRVGGDDFAVLLLGQSAAEVEHTADEILGAVRAPVEFEGHEIYLTASLGMSLFPADGQDAPTLLNHAAAAMHEAKGRGQNNCCRFTPGLENRQARRLRLGAALRHVLESGQFEIHWQPQVSLDRTLAGFEVLLAWTHPEFGRVTPGEFIPIAEENGMILPIGEWVLQQACAQARIWRDRGLPPVKIAVNVSAVQFADPEIVERVARSLEMAGLEGQVVELELTESTIMRDFDASARRMARLRALGVSISIDDFGTGYSSLSYLQRLPVDTLKIDRSFVQDLGRSTDVLGLIRAIVSLAHGRRLTVVAEGVETEEQWRALRETGCDLVQGHYLAPPLTTADAEKLLLHQVSATAGW